MVNGMTFVALSCPQCSAPLPRVAIWRSVKCAACGSMLTRTEQLVRREDFRQAWKRMHSEATAMGAGLVCGGASYRLLQNLGIGEISKVHLALRVGVMPALVVMKLSSAPEAATAFAREAEVLRELQRTGDDVTGAFFSRLLPEVVAVGAVEDSGHHALVVRHPNGFWGSLAALNERFPAGLDPRHAVWIWRRMLDVLGFIHDHGWCHGDVRPEHALVNPEDHAVRLIGWASARQGADGKQKAADLSRSARVVQVLLSGDAGVKPAILPPGLARLVTQAAEEPDFCHAHGARGLDSLLRAAAHEAFGPPAFVPLVL
jgi:serine/threonine protein kinase